MTLTVSPIIPLRRSPYPLCFLLRRLSSSLSLSRSCPLYLLRARVEWVCSGGRHGSSAQLGVFRRRRRRRIKGSKELTSLSLFNPPIKSVPKNRCVAKRVYALIVIASMYRVVQLNLTPKSKYLLCCLIDIFLFLGEYLFSGISNSSPSHTKL